MLNVGEHRRVLMRENLAQLDDRIDWIQEECIILYLNSLIGEKGEQISAYQFSKITNIRLSTVTGILNRKVRFRSYQQRRWCCCILYNWDRIVDELIKRHTAEGKKFDKSLFEKNFNEAFSQWITFARDLKQLNNLEAHIAKYQKLFVPKNK
jgi:hypothetical protein